MKRIAMTAMLLLVTGNVFADDEAAAWRVGGSLVYSDYETDDNTINDGDTGFKAHAQYRFNSWLGVEGAFYVGPEFRGDRNLVAAGGETETTYQGITFHGIAYLPSPVERMDFFLKGGYFNFYDVDLKVDGVTTTTGSADGLALGFGTAIDAADNLGVRIEFDWYDVSSVRLFTIGIGAEYRF